MPNLIEIGGGSRKFSKKLVDLTRNDPRDKSAKDFTQIRQIKDEQGVVLWEHDKIIERWKGTMVTC